MTVNTVLKNGRVVTPSGIFEGGLAIESGKIVAIAKNSLLPPAEETIDVKGGHILPGLIDAHSHCHGMGRSDWEDFETGTRAAAAGGISTIFEMPITTPPTSTNEAFLEKKRIMEKKAVVNFALYGGAGSQNIDEIPKLAAEGAIAFKTFMPPPMPGREKDLWGLYITDDGSFLEVLRTIGRTGSISCIHAENAEIVNYLQNRLQSEGRMDLSAFLESRPGIVEAEAVSRAAMFASMTETRMHIAHVCAKEAVEVIEEVKRTGQALTAETCHNYLTFSHDEVKHLGPYAKMYPPIRNAEDRSMLWKALHQGVIDIVTSDHGPFTKNCKEAGHEDIWKAFLGVPAFDVMLPVMLTHVNRGLMTLQDLIKVLSENVAKIFGLYPRKGVLQIGADADIVVVDLKRKKKLNIQDFYTKAKDVSLIYDGFEVRGIPVLNMVRGVKVMKDGEVIGKPGTGQFVKSNKETSNGAPC